MKIPSKKFDGKEIKKFVIVPSQFGFRWKVTTEDGHTTYPLDGWITRQIAYQDFVKKLK